MTTGSPVGGAGLGAPGDAGLSGVRERLIEAMAATMFDCPLAELHSEDSYAARATASGMLAAVLPLIGAQLDQKRAIDRDTMREGDDGLTVLEAAYWRGRADAWRLARDLVRSWAADGAR